MNKLRKRRNLDRYLDSYGSEMPLDWEEYIEGAVMQDRCVFCDEYHINYIVYAIDAISEKRRDVGVRACEECAQHVEAMLIQQYGLGSNQGLFSERKNPNDIKENKNIQNIRWEALTQNLTFDEEAYKYVVHLNPNRDRYILDECERCYICTRKPEAKLAANAYHEWTTIQVPVKHMETMEAGEVYICESCRDYDVVDIDVTYQYFIETEKLFICKCSSCKKKYYIDHVEREYRDMLSSNPIEPEWLCPECSYNVVDIMEDGVDNLFLHINEAPRHAPMERFVPIICMSCHRQHKLDLMMSPEHIMMRYHIHSNSYICEDCLNEGIKSFLINDKTFHFIDNIYIAMKFDGELWDYAIIRIGHRKLPKMEELLIGRTDIDEPANAVLRAMEEARNILFGNQKEIFDDGEE